MKRINAQWVFLIILALWIPVLCFADETIESEQETVIEETIVVSDVYGPPYEPKETSLIFEIWAWGVIGVASGGGLWMLFLIGIMMWCSIKLNYHLYVTHGQFAFWFSKSDTDELTQFRNNRREVYRNYCKKKKIDTDESNIDDSDMLGWWCCWLFLVIGIVGVGVVAILWPVAVILLGPFLLVRYVAIRKRKKQVFQDKLKGNETNGIIEKID